MDNISYEQAKVTNREILEKGFAIVKKTFSNHPVPLTREEMCDYLNFEVVFTNLIENMKATEGKTQEELIEMAKKAIKPE